MIKKQIKNDHRTPQIVLSLPLRIAQRFSLYCKKNTFEFEIQKSYKKNIHKNIKKNKNEVGNKGEFLYLANGVLNDTRQLFQYMFTKGIAFGINPKFLLSFIKNDLFFI